MVMKKFLGLLFLISILGLSLGILNARSEDMKAAAMKTKDVKTADVKTTDVKIEKGKKVKFDYTLKVDGQVVETSKGKEPLAYTQGSQQIVPGLESQLEGLHVGDQKLVTVTPKDAYGEVNKDAFRDFAKTAFPKGMTPEKGMVLELKGPNDQKVPATVWEIKEDKVVLNFNHPLAGKTLEFDVKIVSIE